MGATDRLAARIVQSNWFKEMAKHFIKPPKELTPAVEEVIKHGVENFSKKELTSAIKHASIPVYRYDRYAPELMEKGFQSDLTKNLPLAGDDLEKYILRKTEMEPEELHGMIRSGKYSSEVAELLADWAKFKSTTPFDKPGLYWGVGERPSTEGIPPYQSSSEKDLIIGAFGGKLDEGAKLRGFEELIQEKPNQILAKYGDIFKIIGLGGATTLGSQLIPDKEAEASPIEGKIGKNMVKALGKVIGKSSAAKKLIGESIDGKIVKDVLKGESGWRYILYEDGSRLPVRQDVLGDIMKEKGTERYMNKLAAQETESSKLLQATKSLQHHMARQQPLINKEAKAEWRNTYSKYMKELNQPEVPWTYVESHNVYLPSEYAKILEDHGVIQIKKGK